MREWIWNRQVKVLKNYFENSEVLQISKYTILGFLDSSDPTQEGPTVLTKGLSTELVEYWKAIKELSIFFGNIFPTIL